MTIFSVYQAAKFLGIGHTKMYRLIKTEKVPCTKIGRAIKIPKELLVEWLKAKRIDKCDTSLLVGPR